MIQKKKKKKLKNNFSETRNGPIPITFPLAVFLKITNQTCFSHILNEIDETSMINRLNV